MSCFCKLSRLLPLNNFDQKTIYANVRIVQFSFEMSHDTFLKQLPDQIQTLAQKNILQILIFSPFSCNNLYLMY